MRRSVLFSRVFSVVIFTVLMTALFTTVIYNYISRSVFTQIKENELLPKARALGNMILSYDDELVKDPQILFDLVNVNDENDLLLGAYVVVTDARGNVVLYSEGIGDAYLNTMVEAAQDVLRDGELRTAQIKSFARASMVVVGVPMMQDDTPRGVVLMLVPLYEAMVAMSSLNGALAVSLLLSMPFVAALVYYVVGRVVRPLRQMRDVAVGMASGNFEARADTAQRGEVGQLGRSLNYLSDRLSRSIAALTLERNRLQQTLDGLREGIVAVDKDGHVTHHNPAVTRLFETLARPSDYDEKLRLIPDAQVWRDFDKVVASGESVVRLIPLGDRTIQISLSPLCDEGQLIAGAVGLFTDVTESERLERTRRDYVANVSHEMRTPLTAMRALLEPLTEGMVNTEAVRARYYSIMLRETMRLSRLIDDLMELSRLQSGTLAFEISPLSLFDVVQELSGKYASIAEDHLLSYEALIPQDCPQVLSNPDRLEQVLVILLDNAMKYTPEGGTVSICARWDKSKATVTVRDTGIGIDPKDQPYVFDRFYKVDKAHSGLGSGLGLSIARELVQVMGERIWLESTPGTGTAFHFTIQRAAQPYAAPQDGMLKV